MNGLRVLSAAQAPGAKALGIILRNNSYDDTVLPAYWLKTGHNPPAMDMYVSWADPVGDGSNSFPVYALDSVFPPGVAPTISWMPWDYTGNSQTQANYTLSKLVDGTKDAYIDAWAATCKAWGKPVKIRLMHEMNTNFYPWGVSATGQANTAAKFVTAWQYIVNRFRTLGVSNVQWVWCPNRSYPQDNFTSVPFEPFYPGDGYVDELGVDTYQYGSGRGLGPLYNQPGATWESLDTVYGVPLRQLSAINPTKPIAIHETAVLEPSSPDAGGNKATFITALFAYLKGFPQLKAVYYFNEDKTDVPADGVNYSVDTSTAALAAWRKVVKDPDWGGFAVPDADQLAATSMLAFSENRMRSALTMGARRHPTRDETYTKGSAGSTLTPSLGTVYFSWFTPALKTGIRNRIYLPMNNSGSGMTSAYFGLYTFNGTTLTKIADSGDVKAAINGILRPTVTIPDTKLIIGLDYVFAFTLNGGTPPGFLGGYPSYAESLIYPELAGKVAGTTLPTSVAKASLSNEGVFRAEIFTV